MARILALLFVPQPFCYAVTQTQEPDRHKAQAKDDRAPWGGGVSCQRSCHINEQRRRGDSKAPELRVLGFRV